MRRLLIGLTLALSVHALPAHADEPCDQFSRDVDLFQSEQDDVARELNRVTATTPAPTKDPALCLALRKYANDAPYFLTADLGHKSCFKTDKDMHDFIDFIHKIYLDVGAMVGGYCTADEIRTPVDSKVLGAK